MQTVVAEANLDLANGCHQILEAVSVFLASVGARSVAAAMGESNRGCCPVECHGYDANLTSSTDLPVRSRFSVAAATKSTPPDQQAVTDDDLDGPASTVRPRVPLFAVPWLAITAERLRFLPLDARSAYLLSLVDGQCSVELIVDICRAELAREEALEVFAHLLQLGAIELRDP